MGKAGLWLQPRTNTNSWLLLCLTGNEIRVKEETGNNNTEQKQRTVLNESVVIVSFFPVRRDAPVLRNRAHCVHGAVYVGVMLCIPPKQTMMRCDVIRDRQPGRNGLFDFFDFSLLLKEFAENTL